MIRPTTIAAFVLSLAIAHGARSETVGQPWIGEPGITETVAQIKARQTASPRLEHTPNRHRHPRNTQSPTANSSVQSPLAVTNRDATVAPRSAPLMGTSFLAITRTDSGSLPPDSMGAVGPTQIFVCLNGRFRLFDRLGNTVSTLDVDSDVFFASVRNNALTSDPHVCFDRISNRWFMSMITEAAVNRVLLAVSSGPTITDTSSFTFFQFQHDFNTATGDPDHGSFADYDTLGVDAQALYVGVSVFTSLTGVKSGATGFVINKQALIAGTLNVTPFRRMSSAGNPGIYTPNGVGNDDPNATEGYFIGPDNVAKDKLVVMRVSSPGGTPILSGPLNITVPDTGSGSLGGVPALGSTRPIDDNDNRLFQSAMRNGSLYTAQNLEVDASGIAKSGGGRDGSRWYEIVDLTGTPRLRQTGTLFDADSVAPRSFYFPSCTVNGQGHMALGCTVSGVNEYIEVAYAGRLAGDPLGMVSSPVTAVNSSSTYNAESSPGTQRWGDYSATVVDPNDNMTFWTFQEFCAAQDSWGVQAVQIKAPLPATPVSCSPPTLPATAAHVIVAVTGEPRNGAGFYDPGVAFPNHLSATINSTDCVVNSATYIDATHFQLDISTTNAAPGPRVITVRNPDGQIASSPMGTLCISPPGAPVVAGLSATGPVSTLNNTPFAFQVTGVDICGTTVQTYSGTVRFTSNDPGAILPSRYAFQTSDNGSRMFTATLKRIGDTTITAIDDASNFSSTFVINVSSGPIFSARPSATPNPGVVGGAVSFSATVTENPPSTFTYNWDFGDGSTASGQTPSHVFTTASTFNCSVTVSDANGGLARASVFVTVTPPPSFTSTPMATPNPASVGQSIQFNAAATEMGGDILSYAWNFTDGSTGQGASPTHIFSTPGTFNVVVTVSDTRGGSAKTTVPTQVIVPVVGIGFDTDGDGFSDDFETAFGTDPKDPKSTPLDGKVAGTPQPLTVTTLTTLLSFSRPGFDSLTLAGSLPIPAGFSAAGSTIAIDVSGVPRLFHLDVRSKGSGGFQLNVKSSGGIVPAQTAKFTMKLHNGSFAPTLADSGLKNATVKKKPITLTVSVIFNKTLFQTQKSGLYTATINRSGASR